MDSFDYYAELGVPRDASAEDIRRAYRKLAAKLHPDVNSGPGAEERFKRVSHAYAVLRDPETRRKYDHFGPDWDKVDDAFAEQYSRAQEARRPSGRTVESEVGFDDWVYSIFQDGEAGLFDPEFMEGFEGFGGGGRGRQGSGGGARGRHSEEERQIATVRLSLEDAAQGGRRELRFRDPKDGKRRTLAVQLPAGLRGGERIRLAGGAGRSDDGRPIDLYLETELLAHPRFRLEGDDLHMRLDVAPWEAALGAEIEVRGLARTFRVRVPAGSRNGSVLRLRGMGFPMKYGAGAGDLLVEIVVQVPPELTPEEREAFETLARVSRFRPRE